MVHFAVSPCLPYLILTSHSFKIIIVMVSSTTVPMTKLDGVGMDTIFLSIKLPYFSPTSKIHKGMASEVLA